jgi:hypothetical protein
MKHFICKTCGTQFPKSNIPPAHCPICDDERQYVGHDGQQWTTLEALQQDHRNRIKEVEPNLVGIGTEPAFAIAQRALLIRTPAGNILWDCISLVDAATISAVQDLGGIAAIAISHPHYYSSMIEWSRAFNAPIYLHAADRAHVMRPDDAICFWEGDTKELWAGLSLIRGGGHFEGGTMLHWPAGAGGKGALLSGDIIQVVPDRRWVSFMYSYPNLIPLPAREIRRIVKTVEPFMFDRIYGAWWNRVVLEDAKAALQRSAERYIAAIREL